MQVKDAGFGGTTRINYEKVENAVDSITSSSEEMDSLFDEFRKSMGVIYQDDVLEGEAGNSLQEKFDELKTKFDAYVNEVKRFAATIEKAKTSTELTEKNIQKNTENLGN